MCPASVSSLFTPEIFYVSLLLSFHDNLNPTYGFQFSKSILSKAFVLLHTSSKTHPRHRSPLKKQLEKANRIVARIFYRPWIIIPSQSTSAICRYSIEFLFFCWNYLATSHMIIRTRSGETFSTAIIHIGPLLQMMSHRNKQVRKRMYGIKIMSLSLYYCLWILNSQNAHLRDSPIYNWIKINPMVSLSTNLVK